MNETQLILAEISKLEDRIEEFSEILEKLSAGVATLLKNADIKPTKSGMSRILDAAPSDEFLDQLEAEEHAKVMCTYPNPAAVEDPEIERT